MLDGDLCGWQVCLYRGNAGKAGDGMFDSLDAIGAVHSFNSKARNVPFIAAKDGLKEAGMLMVF